MNGQQNISNGLRSIVGNGQFNVAGGLNAGVFSGTGNQAFGQNSAILGGLGNVIGAGFQAAGIFGNGINAVANDTFHTNCLNACDTPLTNPGHPPGTIFRHAGGALPLGALPLFIMP